MNKNFLLITLISILLACSENKQENVQYSITKTNDTIQITTLKTKKIFSILPIRTAKETSVKTDIKLSDKKFKNDSSLIFKIKEKIQKTEEITFTFQDKKFKENLKKYLFHPEACL